MGLANFLKRRREKKEAQKEQLKQNESEKKVDCEIEQINNQDEEKNDTADQEHIKEVEENKKKEEQKAAWRKKQYYIETHKEDVKWKIVPRFDDNYISQIESEKKYRNSIPSYIDNPFFRDKNDHSTYKLHSHKGLSQNYPQNMRKQIIGDNFEYAIFEVIQEYLHPHHHLGWMNHLFKDKEYHAYVMANLLIPNGNLNETNEIDSMIISRKGIIVIEAKSHVGYFDGDIMDRRWVYYPHQSSDSRSEISFPMSNPFYQNATHISSIQRAINYSDYFGWVDKMNELAIDMEYKSDLEEQGINTQWILSDYDATYDLASMDLEEYEDFCNREPYPDPIMAPGKEHFKGHYWDIPIISAVVVNNTCRISPNIQEGLRKKLNKNYKLIRFCHLPDFLHDIFDTTLIKGWPDVLTDKEVDYLYEAMCQYRNPSLSDRQRHLDFAKETRRRIENNYI